MPFETTASRLWKKLSREDRLAAARAFWKETPPEAAGAALGVLMKVRHVRPQAARALPVEEQARTLASIADVGEAVASALLVALHIGERRAMLNVFLDAVGLAHEDGLLKDEAVEGPAVEPGAARRGMEALRAAGHSDDAIRVYFNTLWLQDPERWGGLEAALAA